jgi:hypothetical protein
MLFGNARRQDVMIYRSDLGHQTVTINAQNPDAARRVVKEQYGQNIQIIRVDTY